MIYCHTALPLGLCSHGNQDVEHCRKDLALHTGGHRLASWLPRTLATPLDLSKSPGLGEDLTLG